MQRKKNGETDRIHKNHPTECLHLFAASITLVAANIHPAGLQLFCSFGCIRCLPVVSNAHPKSVLHLAPALASLLADPKKKYGKPEISRFRCVYHASPPPFHVSFGEEKDWTGPQQSSRPRLSCPVLKLSAVDATPHEQTKGTWDHR